VIKLNRTHIQTTVQKGKQSSKLYALEPKTIKEIFSWLLMNNMLPPFPFTN